MPKTQQRDKPKRDTSCYLKKYSKMKVILATLLLFSVFGDISAECGFDLDDVYDACNSNFTIELGEIFDNFTGDTTEEYACGEVEDLLYPIAECLYVNVTFENCTEEELHDLEDDLYDFYNASCIKHDACLVDYDLVIGNLTNCFLDFNDSLHIALAYLEEDSFDFNTACDEFHSALQIIGPCFEESVAGHLCSEEALYNLTIFYYEYDDFYNDTCGNDYFDGDVLSNCSDPVSAFSGMAYCFGSYLYDYEGYQFDDSGEETDLSLEEDDCSEAYEYIYDTAICAGTVAELSGCGDLVEETLLWLLQNITTEFSDVCGDDLLADLSLDATPASLSDGETTTSGGSDLMNYSIITLAIGAMLSVICKIFQ